MPINIGFSGSRLLSIKNNGQIPKKHEIIHILENQILRFLYAMDISCDNCYAISQIAIGADTLFFEACKDLKIPHRLFLPQTFDKFISGAEPNGKPDFTEAQKKLAIKLRKESTIIEEKVINHSSDRNQQFIDTNDAILDHSHIVIALIRHDVEYISPGGALDFLVKAQERNLPALELRIDLDTKTSEPYIKKYIHA